VSPTITVVDYGMGNLHSVARAVEHVGGTPKLTADPSEVAGAERLILPGVGAFEACKSNLVAAGMVEPVLEFLSTGRPFLGICVGMQLLFDRSEEFGSHDGLGLIPGVVRAIPSERSDGSRRKVPHIGWSALELGASNEAWNGSLFDGATPGRSTAYFVHSFAGEPAEARDSFATADYDGYRLCAAVRRDNMFGVQFHPEKSAALGLGLLRRFQQQ